MPTKRRKHETPSEQIKRLANVLMAEFGVPIKSEGAVDMAIRVLHDQKELIEYREKCIAYLNGEMDRLLAPPKTTLLGEAETKYTKVLGYDEPQ